MEDVLLLFSGGRDSFLSACILVEEGHTVMLVTFENGLGLAAENAMHGASRLIKRYGDDRIRFLGVQNVWGIWRELLLPFYNMLPAEISSAYGELSVSQFNCLTCRMAMYAWAIIWARQHGIRLLAEGAREDQKFLVELPRFMNRLRGYLSQHGMELRLPVYDLTSDQHKKNMLLLRGFVPKTLEPQCLLGVPLKNGLAPESKEEDAGLNVLELVILPRLEEVILENAEAEIANRSRPL